MRQYAKVTVERSQTTVVYVEIKDSIMEATDPETLASAVSETLVETDWETDESVGYSWLAVSEADPEEAESCGAATFRA